MAGANNFPKLHNAMWPGLVGRGSPDIPAIDLDTMLDLTAKAEVDGVKFDGIDIFHAAPHTTIDFTDDEVKRLADKAQTTQSRHRLDRSTRLAACGRRLGHGVGVGPQKIRRAMSRSPASSASACVTWACALTASSASIRPPAPPNGPRTPMPTPRRSPRPSARPARRRRLRRAAGREGEICWGGMHSWKDMLNTLEETGPPADHRLPGRHGPHAALHDGLQCAEVAPASRQI